MLKNIFKRFTSLTLVLVMLLSMIPAGVIHVHAASGSLTMDSAGLNASYSGDGTWSGGGTTASGSVDGDSGCSSSSAQSTTLELINASTDGATMLLKFDYNITSNNGTVRIGDKTYTGSGSFSELVGSGKSVTIDLTSGVGSGKKTAIELTNIVLESVGAASRVTFVYDSSLGKITVDGTDIGSGEIADISSDPGSVLTAVPNTGDTFAGWLNADNSIISTANPLTYAASGDATIYPLFVSGAAPSFQTATIVAVSGEEPEGNGNKSYFNVASSGVKLFGTLSEAIADSEASNRKAIIPMSSGTLPAGTYTIPSGSYLLIPFDSANTLFTAQPFGVRSDVTPSYYRTLTLAEGAHIVVNGAMSVSAQHFAPNGGTQGAGSPSGPVGRVHMSSNSSITVNSGGALYAWGFITGSGNVIANSGANIHENFQFNDFRGGTEISGMKAENGTFPLSQYYVQNIEVPLTLYAGAVEHSYTSIFMRVSLLGGQTINSASVAFIGKDSGMFQLANGYVTKRYDGSTDRLIVDIYGDISISPIKMGIANINLDSSDYELPINSNITVNANSGTTTVKQNIALLPGAEINIKNGAMVALADGINMHIYDADQWGGYCGVTDAAILPVKFAPSKTTTHSVSVDAKVVIEAGGSVEAELGGVFTTEGGAAITGTEGAIIALAAKSDKAYQYQNDGIYVEIPITPAKLLNADGSYTETAAYTEATDFVYRSGRWHTFACDGVYVDGRIEPTCSTEGKITHTCGCGHEYYESLGFLDHTPAADAVKENDVAPKCEEVGGYDMVIRCIVCNEVISSQHTTVPATGHPEDKREVVAAKAPTCIEIGLTEGEKCTVCGEMTVAQVEISPLGHTNGDSVRENDTPSTCIVNGGYDTVVYCTVCDVEVDRVHEEYDLAPHQYTVNVPAQAAVCGSVGWYEYNKCSVCDAKDKYVEIQALTHDYVLKYDVNEHWHECSRDNCPEKIIDKEAHSGGTATCTRQASCDICNVAYGTSLGHDFENSTEFVSGGLDGHRAVCAREGCSVQASGDLVPHSGGEATCIAYAKCEACGEDYGRFGSHDLTEVAPIEPTCETAGNIHYWHCSVCNKNYNAAQKELTTVTLNATGHSRVAIPAVAATCTQDGIKSGGLKCSVCEAIIEAPETEPATGHNYSSTVTKKATCTEEGERTYTCANSNCDEGLDEAGHGKSYTEVIVMLPHSFVIGRVVDAKAPTCTEDGWEEYGICDNCDAEDPAYVKVTIPAGHVWSEAWTGNGEYHWHECTRETCPITDVSENSGYTACVPNEDDGSCLTAVTCSVCGEITTEAASAHSFTGDPVSNGEGTGKHTYTCVNGCTGTREESCTGGKASCTELAKCESCGAEYGELEAHSYTELKADETNHWHKCENCDATTEAEAHVYGEWIIDTDANCTTDGSKHHICSACQFRENAKIEATGHAWADTLTGDGQHHWYNCGNENCPVTENSEKEGYAPCTPNDDDGDCISPVLCSECGSITKAGNETHTMSPWAKVEGEDKHEKHCTVEGCTAANTTAACAGTAATCTELSVCDTCGAEFGGFADHVMSQTWSSDGTKHWRECTNANCDHIADEGSCAGGEATCTDAAICDTCDNAYGEALGHAWSDELTWNSGFHWYPCARCSEKKDEAEHSGTGANCQTQATCSACGQLYGNKGGHVETDGDGRCDLCDSSLCENHTWENISQLDPTCLEDGLTAYVQCSVCHDIQGEAPKAIPATGHDFVSGDKYAIVTEGHRKLCANANCNVQGELEAHAVSNKDNSCLTAEVCVCKHEITPAAGEHSLTDWVKLEGEDKHERHCTVEGCTAADVTEACFGTAATCTKLALCESCNSEFGGYAEHVFEWAYDSNKHWKACTNPECSETRDEADHGFDPWASNGDNTHARSCECGATETGDCAGGEANCTDAAICETCETAYGEATGHAWADTLTGDGKNHWYNCGNENCPVTENSEKEGYAPCTPNDDDGDCTTDILCAECESVTAEGNAEHSMSRWAKNPEKDEHERHCTVEGCTAADESGACFGTAATCTELSVCATCGARFGGFADHVWADTWTSNGTSHWIECTNEKCQIVDRKGDCAGGEATCTDAAVCETCENAYGDALGHDFEEAWTSDGTNHWHACTRCEEKAETAKHALVRIEGKAPTCEEDGYSWSRVCEICDYAAKASDIVPATGHEAATPVKENEVGATCTEKGSYDEVVYCEKCDEELSRTTKETAALGHLKDVLLDSKDPTCTETGLELGWKCSRCGEISVAQTEIPALGHKPAEAVTGYVAATCTTDGYTGDILCTVCDEITTKGEKIDALGHVAVVDEAVEPTCTENGLTEGKHCEVCREVLVAQTVIDALGHTEIVDKAVEPTCTETGLTEGKHCEVCGEILVPQETVKALGHKIKQIPGKAPTCTEAGYDVSYVCEVCGHVELEAEVLPATGHSPASAVEENRKPASCTEDGSYDSVVYCKTCSFEISRETKVIPATGHTEGAVRNENVVKPDCVTEGSHDEVTYCTVCGEACKTVHVVDPALGHKEEVIPAIAPTCTKEGATEGKRCTVCGVVTVAPEAVEKLPHTEVEIPAVEPTCNKDGATAGVKCSVCQVIIDEPDRILAIDHNWGPGRITVDPTCEEVGVRTFTCSMCRHDKTADEPALGHELENVPAQKPTYTSIGWEEYQRCTREDCFYNNRVDIPALGEPTIGNFEEFIENLSLLEHIADNYVKKVSPGKDPASLVIKYIRTGVDRYNSGSWNIMAGYEDKDFAAYVAKYEADYNLALADGEELMKVTGMKNLTLFDLPSGDEADIGHIFGLMDISYTNIVNANVSGWAGDTVDLLSAADQYGVVGTTVEELVAEIGTKYFLKSGDKLEIEFGEAPIEGSFSDTDVRGDLDGYYIVEVLTAGEYENQTLTEIFSDYMVESLTDRQRAAYFLKNKLGGVTLRTDVRDAVFNVYSADKGVVTLEGTREFNATGDKMINMRKAVCYVFADYICKLAGDWVEDLENEHLTVFDTKTSTLAPGITQKIFSGTTGDNQTMVYYVATADVTRGDVHVHANYNNNDPGQGWQMQRVLEQSLAAQKNYTDPNFAHYNENFNIVAAVNGGGYNMHNGAPGGLFVMEGYEWNPSDGNQFFGILSDGTALIGTHQEYLELKAQGKVKEAIGAFGTPLIRDGKITITQGGSYYDGRASRTAVGVTASGKVVILVVDGRQIGLSCGASMAELAQLMLDAGCCDAINLDGGGSSTYVAKPEGESDLRVVSNPSDGAPRSVSTSIFFASTAPSSTAFDHAVITSNYNYLTIGSSIQLTASAVSATGNVVEMPEGVTWAIDNESLGSVDQNGKFTAAANGTVTVKLMLNGQEVGSKKIFVVVPDNVYFEKAVMNAVYGEAVTLPICAVYEGKPVVINENDVVISLANPASGTVDGFTLVGDEASEVRNVVVIGTLAATAGSDDPVQGVMNVAMFRKDEASFDFDNVTGGDRQFAFDREVSNSIEGATGTYRIDDPDKDMVTTYTFALDMSEIPIPSKLADLTYMLPGADMEGASAWNFLLQLAERVSVLTNVTPELVFDKNFDVDYSGITVSNEYFTLDKDAVVFDEETNTLKLRMNWVDQEQPIDANTANPLCIVTGIKLTPKADADWGTAEVLRPVNYGTISYDIYLRTNALFSFASKPENQEKYNLYPFDNKDVIINGDTEKGGHFSEVYTTFSDSYTLIKGQKEGWLMEDGGWAYYENGMRYVGFCEVDGLYYDFGTDGINIGQNKHTGLMTIGGKEYYAIQGKMFFGWQVVDPYNVSYFNEITGVKEKLTKAEIPSTCIIDGYCDYTSESGATKHVDYDDAGGHDYVKQSDGSYVCELCGYVRIEMADVTVTLDYYTCTYTGKPRTPATYAVSSNGIVLTKPGQTLFPDYSSVYKNNINVGTASVTLRAAKYGIYSDLNTWRGNAAGEITVTYQIRPDIPANKTIRIVEQNGKALFTWGEANTPGVTYVLYKSADGENWEEFATTTATEYVLDHVEFAGYSFKLGTRKIVEEDLDGDGVKENNTYDSLTLSAERFMAPVVTVGTNVTTGKPSLKWNLIGNATGYDVYRATSADGEFVKVFTTNYSSYTHSSAQTGFTYYYKVVALFGTNTEAVDDDAKTLFSNVVSYNIPGDTVTVVVTHNDKGYPKVTWNRVTGAATYTVYRSEAVNGVYKKMFATTGTSYSNSLVEAGKTYYYKVETKFGNGSTTMSEPVAGSMVVTALTVTATHNDKGYPRFTWNEMTGATSYTVYRSDSATGEFTKIYTTTGTSYTNTSAKAGKTYYYKVEAVLNGGTTVVSDVVENSVKLTALTVTATHNDKGYPRFTWNKLAAATSYTVYRNEAATGEFTKIYTTTGTSYTNTSAKAGKTYYYIVEAVLSGGTTVLSDVVENSVKLGDLTVTATHNDKGSPRLTWNKLTGATSYTVYRSETATGEYTKMYTTTGTSYTNTSAEIGKTYFYRVEAELSGGTTVASEPVENGFETADPVVKTANREDGYPRVLWGRVTGADSYVVYRSDDVNGTYKKMFTTKGLSYTNTSAEIGKTYFYKVEVIFKDGTSKISDPVENGFVENKVVFDITVGSNDAGKPTLKWKAIGGASSYAVYRSNTVDGEYKSVFSTKGTTYTHASAVEGNTYYYKVKVFLTDGTEVFSDVVTNK